ncbi:MAG: hypothetical protein RLY85_1915, partial [Bacteroidota bacterium]
MKTGLSADKRAQSSRARHLSVILQSTRKEMQEKLKQLSRTLDGQLYTDKTMRTLYATDASAYREMPLAVAIPQT